MPFDPSKEAWLPYKSGSVQYEVSNYGRVRRYLKPFVVAKHLYPQVYMSGRGKVHVHHLVANLFIGERPTGLIVGHKDDNPLNPYVGNLEYIPQRENVRRAKKVTKLNADQVQCIRGLFASGMAQVAIARLFPVSAHQIYMIVRRKAWVDLPEQKGCSQ